MDIKTLIKTLQPLFDLSTGVMGTNFQFQQRLALRIRRSGRFVENMTLKEVQQLVDETTAEFNNNQETP